MLFWYERYPEFGRQRQGRGALFFNRACASFPIVRFCGGNITWQNPDFSGFPLQGYVLTNLFLSPSFCRMEGL
ncbi:hypothetical protein EAI25_05475 [Akkermansia muciniphila]|nr:hypothetical protein [Akkermansia muciniphila]